MRKSNFNFAVAAIILCSMALASTAKAAPVQFKQVVQVVNAKPGKAATGDFAQLRLAGEQPTVKSEGDDDKDKKKVVAPPQQDERVITETRSEIVEDDVCDCVSPTVITNGFPYGYLALGAIPAVFLIPPGKDNPPEDSTPTPTVTPTVTPTATPTMTPTMTPTPTPEPMTILLFGTGLAGVGFAARRRFGKKDDAVKG